MKRLIAAIAGLCLLATSAIGFYQSRDSNYNQNIVSGGGGGPSIASLFTATSQSTCGTTCTLASSVSFSTGLAVVGIAWDQSGGGSAPTAMTINGVSATQIGTNVSDGTTNGVAWYQASVTSGTGSITATSASGIVTLTANGFMITGNSSNTPISPLQTNGFAIQVPDPQTLTLLGLSAGSVAACIIGRNFPAAQNPTSWGGVARLAAAEGTNAGGNGTIIAGGTGSGLSGTVVVTATGPAGAGCISGACWLYSGMLCAAWR